MADVILSTAIDKFLTGTALTGGEATTLRSALIALGGADVINDLVSGGVAVPLSAAQGVALKALIDAKGDLLAANNLSDLENAATAATNLGLGAADDVTHGSLTVDGAVTVNAGTDSVIFNFGETGRSFTFDYGSSKVITTAVLSMSYKDIEKTANIYPQLDNSADLGQIAKRYRDGFFGGTVATGNLEASGTVTAAGGSFTGDLNLTSSTSAKPLFNVENTNSNSAGAVIQVYKNTPSPGINDTIGSFNFLSKSNQGSGRVYSSIIARIHDPVAATLSGELKFNLWSAGSESTVMTLLDDRVGIGTTTPAEKLDVVGNIKSSGTVTTGGYTVATLPTPATGMRCYVTDSNRAASTHFGSTVIAAGGGTEYVVPVFYDGTNWIIA